MQGVDTLTVLLTCTVLGAGLGAAFIGLGKLWNALCGVVQALRDRQYRRELRAMTPTGWTYSAHLHAFVAPDGRVLTYEYRRERWKAGGGRA